MTMTAGTTGFNVFTGPTGIRYLDVADLATIAGLSAAELDRLKPDAWGMPRDFTWQGGKLWFAILSLPGLFDELQRHDQHDAVLRLRERLLAWVDAAISERERISQVSQGASPGARLHPAPGEHPNAGGKAAPARESWLSRWEAQHE